MAGARSAPDIELSAVWRMSVLIVVQARSAVFSIGLHWNLPKLVSHRAPRKIGKGQTRIYAANIAAMPTQSFLRHQN